MTKEKDWADDDGRNATLEIGRLTLKRGILLECVAGGRLIEKVGRCPCRVDSAGGSLTEGTTSCLRLSAIALSTTEGIAPEGGEMSIVGPGNFAGV